MKRLIVAFGFLTRVPMPQVVADTDDFAAAIRWYPVVGACIGMVVAGAGWIGAQIDPWTGALSALTIWVAITGALHLDGLADLADGLGAAHGNRDRLIAVMADPHIGSFGVVMIALQLLAKLVLLHAVSAQGWAVVIVVPMLARMGPLCWARWVPLLREGGLGGMVAGKIRVHDLVFWGCVTGCLGGPVHAVAGAPALIALFGWWLIRRVGGVSGDCHGAGIEFVETGMLVALAIAGRV